MGVRVKGIIDIVSGKDKYDDVAYMLGEPIVNFLQSVVDDTIRANADFQYQAGLNPKIRRTSTRKCSSGATNLWDYMIMKWYLILEMMCLEDIKIADVLWNMNLETGNAKMYIQNSGRKTGKVV